MPATHVTIITNIRWWGDDSGQKQQRRVRQVFSTRRCQQVSVTAWKSARALIYLSVCLYLSARRWANIRPSVINRSLLRVAHCLPLPTGAAAAAGTRWVLYTQTWLTGQFSPPSRHATLL